MYVIAAIPGPIADAADSNATRAVAYCVAGAACIHAGWRESVGSERRNSAVWPTFWFVTAGLLMVMALGRMLDVDELVTELGRSHARVAGWYRTRRGLQAALVGTVTAVWMVAVFVAIWRVPERRRRYLPTALVVFTISCFAAIRVVSLHHVDALLYNRSIEGVRVVAIVEWGLIALAVLATYWHPFPSTRPPRRSSVHVARS